VTRKDLLDPLMHHDPSDVGSPFPPQKAYTNTLVFVPQYVKVLLFAA